MSHDLVKHDAPGLVRSTDDLARVSKMLADSGFFKDAKDAAQCGVKVLAGLEMGFGAFASMTGIHIIQGKPSVGAHLMAAAVKRHPRYDYRVKHLDNESCTLAFYQDGENVGEEAFTMDDAKRAGLLSNPTWKNYPRNMLFARAMSNGIRFYCPDVFDAPTYTPEELGATVDAEGDVIDVPSRPAKQPEPEPVEDDEPEEVEESIGQERGDKMSAQLDALSFRGRSQLQLVAATIGRTVDSLADLTQAEAMDVWSEAKRIREQEAA